MTINNQRNLIVVAFYQSMTCMGVIYLNRENERRQSSKVGIPQS